MRWRHVVDKLSIRCREPYAARHSSVSWNLMIGRNPLWTARQHGHSVQVMLTTYGTWIEGATEADIEMIKAAMAGEATGTKIMALNSPSHSLNSPEFGTDLAPKKGWGRLSWRKIKHFNVLTGGADGT
jgi:hypothetical protein